METSYNQGPQKYGEEIQAAIRNQESADFVMEGIAAMTFGELAFFVSEKKEGIEEIIKGYKGKMP